MLYLLIYSCIILHMPNSHPILQKIALRIKGSRSARKWSIRELAERSGVSPRFLTTLESGEGNISVVRLSDVCNALGIPLHEIFAPDPDMSRGVVALVGLKGAGKSTLGKALAAQQDIPYSELDALIEEEAGMSLEEIFSLHGESYYRRMELEALQNYLSRNERGVLSTGGGIVTHGESWDLLKDQCVTVWLHASPEEHMERVLQQGDQRPVKGRTNAMDELRLLLQSRERLYRKAHIHVSTSHRPPMESVTELIREVQAMVG
jgi:XRE family aerobic/anaerobic benzoate catabolism transcriptional regulator